MAWATARPSSCASIIDARIDSGVSASGIFPIKGNSIVAWATISSALLSSVLSQRWVEALASNPEDVKKIQYETLMIHGREDVIVAPVTSKTLSELIPNSQLHMFGHCGHWTQIEQNTQFNELVLNFFAEEK